MATDGAGYGKPPKAGRFQPGQSGNPHGRPKANSLRTDLLEELAENIELTDVDGSRLKLSKQRALIKMLMAAALQNEKSAIASLLSVMKFCSVGAEVSENELTLDTDHIDMLKKHIARVEASNLASLDDPTD